MYCIILHFSLSLHPQETHINLDITDSWNLRLPLFRWETGEQTQMRQWQREQEGERVYCNVRSALQVSDVTKLDYNQWNCPSVRWCSSWSLKISFCTGSCRQGYKVLQIFVYFITKMQILFYSFIEKISYCLPYLAKNAYQGLGIPRNKQ